MDVEQPSDHKLMTPSGMGLLVCGAGSHPSCHLGVNLNRYSGSGSCIPWHSDNESLFGPPNQLELMVSIVPGDVPSSITLDRGDLLVMGGSAQSEYAYRTVPGLQGPRVNLTFRWFTQDAASCPLAGVVGCVLPTCAQGFVEPSSRGWGGGGK